MLNTEHTVHVKWVVEAISLETLHTCSEGGVIDLNIEGNNQTFTSITIILNTQRMRRKQEVKNNNVPVYQTDLRGAVCMIEAGFYVCVHVVASRWLTFVGSRGQCPPLSSSSGSFSFLVSRYTGGCSPVFPLLRWGVGLQSSWRISPVSAHHKTPLSRRPPSSCPVSSSSALCCQLIVFLVAKHNLRTDRQSIYSACGLVFFIQLQIKVLSDNGTFTVCL